ncbi:uncharacterized protein LOC116616631 [Nematostella vectensis]|uniref:uncharacterized protein LOC116616631 n=1 Tax=Nematostella vectensis TaxID=45351 RepID=UPI0013904E6B|nr:uncharacterized protein LOC116616631 [Nematostella vectensis]
MKLLLKLSILVGLALFAITGKASALKCYTCNTEGGPDGANCNSNLVTCSEQDAVCNKHVFKFHNTVKKYCSTREACESQKKDCQTGDSCENYCCTGDGCNAGAQLSLHYLFPVLLVVAVRANGWFPNPQ